jgi:hypothetical protein
MSAPEAVVELAVTVRFPWAAALAYGPKRVENRGRRIHPRHHGRLIAIHAGSTVATNAMQDQRITRWLECQPREVGRRIAELSGAEMQYLRGQVLAVATIAGCHQASSAEACCWPWGDREYLTPGQPAWHIELAAPVKLGTPVGPVRGALNVPWTLPGDVADRVTAEYLRSR